jgi:hypothetical protein
MIHKGLAVCAVLVALAQGQFTAFGQASQSPASHPQASHTAPAPAPAANSNAQTPPGAAAPAAPPDCADGTCDIQPAHISIATPAPAAAPWPWQERIAWGANIVLVVLGYISILVALSVLRKIERQTAYAELAAQSAQETSQAVLAQTQAMVRADRPWILMSVRPSQTIENGFAVMATNRGRSPARIVSMVDEIVTAIDEAHLPPAPEYKNKPAAPTDTIILLPGEATEIISFNRADVKRICESEEQMVRVEKWEERIFLYGRVEYRDLTDLESADPHESSWFCWYIHGRQKSGMVPAGSPAYNRHT